MIYLINNKYYIRVAPLKYTEIDFELKNNDVIIKPTRNKIEANGNMIINEVNFQNEKEKIKYSLLDKDENDSSNDVEETRRYRKRR